MAQNKITGNQVNVRFQDLADYQGTASNGNTLTYNGTGWEPNPPGGTDTLFVFQVGAPTANHSHHAMMSTAQAQLLIHGTLTDVPVADVSQPSLVLTTEPNGNDLGPSLHTHDITVYFDYVNSTFLVTNITNNGGDNHTATLVGQETLNKLTDVDAPVPAGGDVLTFDDNTFTWVNAPPVAVQNTQIFWLNTSAAKLFDGAFTYDWIYATPADEGAGYPQPTFVTYVGGVTDTFTGAISGTYKLTLMCRAFANDGWSADPSEFGTQITTSPFSPIDTSLHYRVGATGDELDPRYATWMDQYVFSVNQSSTFQIGARAFSFNNESLPVRFVITATLERIGPAMIFA